MNRFSALTLTLAVATTATAKSPYGPYATAYAGYAEAHAAVGYALGGSPYALAAANYAAIARAYLAYAEDDYEPGDLAIDDIGRSLLLEADRLLAHDYPSGDGNFSAFLTPAAQFARTGGDLARAGAEVCKLAFQDEAYYQAQTNGLVLAVSDEEVKIEVLRVSPAFRFQYFRNGTTSSEGPAFTTLQSSSFVTNGSYTSYLVLDFGPPLPERRTLRVVRSTKVTVAGQPSVAAALKVGDAISVSYDWSDNVAGWLTKP